MEAAGGQGDVGKGKAGTATGADAAKAGETGSATSTGAEAMQARAKAP